jgi:two-component system sensor histidine kinase AlgZ
MQDSQILSTLQDVAPLPQPAPRPHAALYDACQVGVALRALLLVELVLAVVALYGTGTLREWSLRLALLTGAALPATLFWLLAACGLKKLLARWPERMQLAAGVALGAVAGLYGCGLLALSEVIDPVPWLAAAASGALAAGALVGALALRARSRLPADTAARLTELQSRIRPHFLFNTLNSAIALVRAEPARAEALLEDLSDLFRYALADQGPSTSLAAEIALARRYLAIEQVRFGERLQLQWALDPKADTARLPPLLLQPLLENAVRHGVEPSASGAQIRISTQRRGATVVIKITNTVPAGPGAQGHGLALANVRDRLRLLHDVQCSFRAARKDGLYQVRIEVPA